MSWHKDILCPYRKIISLLWSDLLDDKHLQCLTQPNIFGNKVFISQEEGNRCYQVNWPKQKRTTYQSLTQHKHVACWQVGSSSPASFPASCSYHCPSCQHRHPCSNLPSWILLKINFKKKNWLVIELVPWPNSFMATSDTVREREGRTVISIAWYNWPRSQLIDKYWIYIAGQPSSLLCSTEITHINL